MNITQFCKESMNPSLDLIDGTLGIDARQDTPLHAQVRRALRSAIEEHFEDGQKFWPENSLIERLGVSQGTVRRALTDLSREGLLQRRAAKGSFVRKAPTGTAATIGVFVPKWDSDLYVMALEELSAACWQAECRFHVYHTLQGERMADAYRQIEKSPQDERLVLLANPPQITQDLYAALSERGYRTVNIGMPIPGYGGAYVGTDEDQVARLAVTHLKELGHRRIALLVNEPMDNPAIAGRVQAFEREAIAQGVESHIEICGTHFWQSSYDAAYEAMDAVWQWGPTAVYAVSDQGAWAVLRWAAIKGIAVPSQLSVMGNDDIRTSRFMHPPLTSIAQPMAAICSLAVRLLWEEKAENIAKLLSPTLMARESTGVAPTRKETKSFKTNGPEAAFAPASR